ncbi:primase-helicase family protein [Bradyrhizobium sp. Leo121]|uniref:primase-helicase family protein n=1 Tax=Bradyrhizobium sp. Leo121 TaxID=1571195 RepID=UPI001028A074|nr:primase-helicase family protein [Bradyrhizobium sp. Leo121]RZN32306.1 hypothetical protein CWO90_13960 [Bradyrhizobium sp. Leo121]
MTTSPFQSIAATGLHPHEPREADNEAHPQMSLDSLVASLLARRAPSSPTMPAAANFENTPIVSEGCGPARGKAMSVTRLPLTGGVYSENDAIARMNEHYFIGRSKGETAIFRINDDGSATVVPNEEFRLEVQNIFVVHGRGSAKPVAIEKFWKESPYRHERTLVFKPGGAAQPGEFNLWRGFGVEPQQGWQKQRRFLRHLLRVICRRDREKFKYLMRLFAWFVQNPDKHAGVVLVLKSRQEGTGKSTVGQVLLEIFGQHGLLVDDKERLLGRFTDHLETTCFVLAEEILFAGDRKSADKMKSMITGDKLQLERKYGSCRQVQNRMKVVATTNHDHAIVAGTGDRRYVVYDVGSEHAEDKEWFDALYQDLADGGTSEFLWLLRSIKLESWHPRMVIRTAETKEQQRMSGDSVSQWSQSCIIADAIIGADPGPYFDLRALISFPDLLNAYTGFCKQTGQRAVGPEVFGRACAEMFGPRSRLPAGAGGAGTNKRPWGYYVPTAQNWQLEVDRRLGVK